MSGVFTGWTFLYKGNGYGPFDTYDEALAEFRSKHGCRPWGIVYPVYGTGEVGKNRKLLWFRVDVVHTLRKGNAMGNMAKKKKKPVKVNWWKVLRNLRRIPGLISTVVALYEKVKDMSDDPELAKLVSEVEDTLESMFG